MPPQYTVEVQTRRMGESIPPEYRVVSPLRTFDAMSEAEAEYLNYLLNHITEEQHMAALTREGRNAA